MSKIVQLFRSKIVVTKINFIGQNYAICYAYVIIMCVVYSVCVQCQCDVYLPGQCSTSVIWAWLGRLVQCLSATWKNLYDRGGTTITYIYPCIIYIFENGRPRAMQW